MAEYMTAEAVADWARHQDADAKFCQFCLTRLAETLTDEGKRLYCPNEMCRNEEQYEIEEEE